MSRWLSCSSSLDTRCILSRRTPTSRSCASMPGTCTREQDANKRANAPCNTVRRCCQRNQAVNEATWFENARSVLVTWHWQLLMLIALAGEAEPVGHSVHAAEPVVFFHRPAAHLHNPTVCSHQCLRSITKRKGLRLCTTTNVQQGTESLRAHGPVVPTTH